MAFIYPPMKLIELIKDGDSIAKKLENHNALWYFSNAGQDAYNNAKTPAQKTMYFLDYLMTVAKTKSKRDVLYRIAYVMASSMDGSSLEFAGYPNILDPEKNPLVNYVKNANLVSDDYTAYGVVLLAELNHEDTATKYIEAKYKPYTRLTYCDDNGLSDKYKIERDIIGAFCTNYSDTYFPPYIYDIVESATDEEND